MKSRIIALIIKELTSIIRDKKIRISLLMPPLIQMLIFTFAATLDVKNVSMGILNRDGGKPSIELVQRFRGAPTFTHITPLQSVEEIPSFLDQRKGIFVLSIDPQFSRDLSSHQEASLQLIMDGRRSNSTQVVAGYANTIIDQFYDDYAHQARLPEPKARLIPRNWFNPNLLYYWYNIPSLVATLSMLTCLIVTSVSVARERELGTFDQLLVSPLMPIEILIGKLIPGIIVGIFEGLLLLTVGVFLFQVPFTGSFPLFFLGLLVFITAMGGVGLFISSLCNTQQQAMLGTFVVMVPSVMLSGFATPIENMPSFLQWFTYVIPLKYMLLISKGVFLKNMRSWLVIQNLWPLALIALVNLSGASWFFRRRLE